MTAEYAKVHGYVSGRVQGVGFRYFTQDSAVQHGLKGWVKNLPDSRVEFIAEGPKGMVNDFVKTINRGPISGHVSNIELEWGKFTGEYESFRITF
ncbi:MAG: acylphosphatase [candidate division Zixibacteria bacterium]|nr:acylphosphatase [candidate division Zixibacteria bacterium]